MAVYSMTGYACVNWGAVSQLPKDVEAEESPDSLAASSTESGRVSVTAELRSVNGRFLDLGMRLPDELRPLEPALRDLLSAAFKRGKIELRMSTQRSAGDDWPQPRPEMLNRLARLEDSVRNWMPNAQGLTVQEALCWCKGSTVAESSEAVAMEAARRCIVNLREARGNEGSRLVSVLMERINRLRDLAAQAGPLVPAVVKRQQQRFIERWNEALALTDAKVSIAQESLQERAINEAAAYSIRIDIAEELARLGSHLDEITRILRAGGEVGKRLDFLVQELLREANTLGSKSTTLELTNISVDMKVAIEQLREQVQNIE